MFNLDKLKVFKISKNADTVLDCEYSVIYENVIIGAIKRNTSDLVLRKGNTKVGKQDVHSLFKINK